MIIRKYRHLALRHLALWIVGLYTLAALAFTLMAKADLAQNSSNLSQDLSRQAYAILQKNCVVCHGAAKMSGLDLRTITSLKAGGERGPVGGGF